MSRSVVDQPHLRTASRGDQQRARGHLGLFLLLVVFDGAVRKWLFPSSEQIIYLLKDVYLAAVLAVLLLTSRVSIKAGFKNSMIPTLFLLYALWVICEALNPALPSLLLGIFGIKSHIFYAALVPLALVAFPDSASILDVVGRWCWIAAPILVLGIVQFWVLPESEINRYIRADEYGVTTFGAQGHVRVTGTFAYITGMAVFTYTAAVLALAVFSAHGWKMTRSPHVIAVLALSVIVAPMTGSRWSVYVLILSVPLFFYGIWLRGALSLGVLLRVVMASGVLMTAVAWYGRQAYEALGERIETAGDAPARYQNLFLQPLNAVFEVNPFGYGAGSTHQAAPAIVPDVVPYSWLPAIRYEDELVRVVLELGPFGLLLLLSLRISLVAYALRCVRRAQTYDQLAFAGAALVYLSIFIFTNIIFNATAAAFYWLFVGFLAVIGRAQAGGDGTSPARA